MGARRTTDAQVLGVVLAAGAGRRMGGPKALVGPLAAGRLTPLQQVCQWVHDAGCQQVFAVIGAAADQVCAAVPAIPWLHLVEAVDWAEGMGASLRAGLRAAAGTSCDLALITLVDLPDVRTGVHSRLLCEAAAGPGTLARASYAGTPGHPVLIGRDWWPEAGTVAVGDRGARALFAEHRHQLVECGDLASGIDTDTPTGCA